MCVISKLVNFIPVTSEDDDSSGMQAALDIPAVSLRRRGRKSRYLDSSLTDPNSEELPPIKRRLFESLRILTVDIGATRTKIMYQFGTQTCLIISPIDSREMWECEPSLTPHQMSRLFQSRLSAHLHQFKIPVEFSDLDAVIFSVPGTVDLTTTTTTSTLHEDMCVVRNMPSMSPKFKGFNFKLGFIDMFPNAKIYAVADNMAAAMGVALEDDSLRCGLVLILGTAPAVATFFRSPHNDTKRVPKSVELGIWQSWVWFTKIPLSDPYGYCGGLAACADGNFKLRDPKTEYKIPHPKSRIRFAIDGSTWKRLRGRLDWLPLELQGNLPKDRARKVWTQRVQTCVNALTLKFHQVYGKPDIVVLLGGNAMKCDPITYSTYTDPDFSRNEPVQVPVKIPPTDEAQMRIHMRGLAQAANYRISQVFANGPDPLARGWTRGGEIYLWSRRREVL